MKGEIYWAQPDSNVRSSWDCLKFISFPSAQREFSVPGINCMLCFSPQLDSTQPQTTSINKKRPPVNINARKPSLSASPWTGCAIKYRLVTMRGGRRQMAPGMGKGRKARCQSTS